MTRLNALLRATAAAGNSTNPACKVTYQAWLLKIGFTYDIWRDASLSVTAQRGYRAGSSDINQQRALAFDYDPEYTWNYEAALRSEWSDRRLTVNANADWIDWRDQQVRVQLTPGAVFDSHVVNAGKSRLYGFELETRGRPTYRLSLYAGVGYSNTHFKDFGVVTGTLSASAEGNEFAGAPRWTASAGATWQHPAGLFANVNANYRDPFYQNLVDQTVRDIRGRTLVNVKVGGQGEHLIASNIFDMQKPVNFFADFDGRTRGLLTDPRIIGVSFEGRL